MTLDYIYRRAKTMKDHKMIKVDGRILKKDCQYIYDNLVILYGGEAPVKAFHHYYLDRAIHAYYYWVV